MALRGNIKFDIICVSEKYTRAENMGPRPTNLIHRSNCLAYPLGLPSRKVRDQERPCMKATSVGILEEGGCMTSVEGIGTVQ